MKQFEGWSIVVLIIAGILFFQFADYLKTATVVEPSKKYSFESMGYHWQCSVDSSNVMLQDFTSGSALFGGGQYAYRGAPYNGYDYGCKVSVSVSPTSVSVSHNVNQYGGGCGATVYCEATDFTFNNLEKGYL